MEKKFSEWFKDGKIFGREPAAIYWGIGVLLNVAATWGLDLNAEQQTSILIASGVLLGWLTRKSVVPVGKYAAEVQKALYQEPPKQPDLIPENVTPIDKPKE